MRPLLAACALSWSVCLAVLLPGAPAAAADASTRRAAERSAVELLRRMDDALAQQSYDGVFTYMRGETVSSLRIMHTVIDGVPLRAPGAPGRHAAGRSCAWVTG